MRIEPTAIRSFPLPADIRVVTRPSDGHYKFGTLTRYEIHVLARRQAIFLRVRAKDNFVMGAELMIGVRAAQSILASLASPASALSITKPTKNLMHPEPHFHRVRAGRPGIVRQRQTAVFSDDEYQQRIAQVGVIKGREANEA